MRLVDELTDLVLPAVRSFMFLDFSSSLALSQYFWYTLLSLLGPTCCSVRFRGSAIFKRLLLFDSSLRYLTIDYRRGSGKPPLKLSVVIFPMPPPLMLSETVERREGLAAPIAFPSRRVRSSAGSHVQYQ